MPRYILVRSLLLFSLTAVVMYMFLPTVMTCMILVILGFSYAMYYIMMLSLSMEIIPEGKAGLFDGMVGLGAAIGALAGPLYCCVPKLRLSVLCYGLAFPCCLRSHKSLQITVDQKNYFQIRRRRKASPTTSTSIGLCRNNCFWFCVGLGCWLVVGDAQAVQFLARLNCSAKISN